MKPLCGLLLACGCLGVQASSLEQVRYGLHQDARAEVEAPLRQLAARGDTPSQLLLADLLAGQGNSHQLSEAMALYQSAFDEGYGELNALGRLAALLERHPLHQARQRAFFQNALQQYAPGQDLTSLRNTLEVFWVYPDLLDPAHVRSLIELYQRACLENCQVATYRAALAERLGQEEQTDAYLRQALLSDPRALDRFHQRLGDEPAAPFRALADTLEASRAELPLAVVQRIGALLSNLGDEYDPRVIGWLDPAIERGSVPALHSRIAYMLGHANHHGPDETFALIDRYEQHQSQQARALRASALQVSQWPTLDPFKAQTLIQALIAEGYQNAYLNLGELYSMGGLDEADQFKAIEAYRQLTPTGHASAFYRLATVYARGRAICHDKVRAYAYARIAVDFGEQGAMRLLGQLENEITPAEIAQALSRRDALLREHEVGL